MSGPLWYVPQLCHLINVLRDYPILFKQHAPLLGAVAVSAVISEQDVQN
jgi:hypothetical protein